MRVFSKNDVVKGKSKIISEMAKGAVFIYPTDTIYGLGCDATNDAAIGRIRELKNRDAKPFSIIAPSLEWITDNCEVNDKVRSWLVKLPGPYTLIMSLKKPSAVCAQTNMGMKTVGIRIPDHWISEIVASFGKPVITTSVNAAGSPPCGKLEELQAFAVDFIIYEGDRAGKPSTVVDLTKGGRVLRR